MPGPWKAWKTRQRFPTLPTAPWKSLHRDFHIPTAPIPVLTFSTTKNETCSRLRRSHLRSWYPPCHAAVLPDTFDQAMSRGGVGNDGDCSTYVGCRRERAGLSIFQSGNEPENQ